MPFMDDILSSASFGESDRLDAVVQQLDALQAKFDALSALLIAKGLLTEAEIAGAMPESPAVLTNDELDRLDVKLP